ncbi:MAG: HAMP domain-containing histidine kinase [Ruminococcus sp.]|nr:HAMP domain-containing histidine kinase [Ruminococcus sp.]
MGTTEALKAVFRSRNESCVITDSKFNIIWRSGSRAPKRLNRDWFFQGYGGGDSIELPVRKSTVCRYHGRERLTAEIRPFRENGKGYYFITFYDAARAESIAAGTELPNGSKKNYAVKNNALTALLLELGESSSRRSRDAFARLMALDSNKELVERYLTGDVKEGYTYISTAAEEVCLRIKPLMDAEEVKFKYDIDSDLFYCLDEYGFQAVAANLLANAVKYNSKPEYKEVEFSLKGEKSANGKYVERVRLTVRDNGDYFDEKTFNDAIVPFKRVRDDVLGEYLGLSFVKLFADRFWCELSLKSDEEYTTIELCMTRPLPPHELLKKLPDPDSYDPFDRIGGIFAKGLDIVRYMEIYKENGKDRKEDK